MTPGEQPLALLEREIAELAAHIHAATCRWLGLIAEFDRREGWASWGCKSCAHWLSYTCALGSGAAREHVRVARRLEELPAIRATFERGELSYSQVRALSRVATPGLEAQLLELARHSTAAQLERVLRAYRGVLARELGPDELVHGERYLTCEHDDDGALMIRARLPAEEGALVMAALQSGRDRLRRDSRERAPTADADDTGAPRPSNPDALVLMADTLLASDPVERTGGERYQVVVHVDLDTLSGGKEDGEQVPACRLEDGEALDPETARRLACDAGVVSIVERGGRPLSVGRKTRSVPPGLRRALASRDHGCRFPGCSQTRFLHAHHIDHWAQGGRTELANLVHLCAHHHRLVHEGGHALARGPGGTLRFTRPDGTAIPAVPELAAGSRQRLRAENRRRGLEITPDTPARHWDGTRLDLPLAIDALVASDDRLEEAHV